MTSSAMERVSPPKSPWVHDTEIYKNYLLIGFKNVKTGKVISFEVSGQFSKMSTEDRDFLYEFMTRQKTVGFNSINFDMCIVFAAIAGLEVGQIKQIANDIIIGQMKHWEVAKEWSFTIPRGMDHIDLIEVAPGKASLKIYNGRIHGVRMQDLPIEPEATLTDAQMDQVYWYWENDLAATQGLWEALQQQITLREAMSKEFKTDLRSKSDAQVAEAVIKTQIEQLTGYAPQKPAKRITQFYYKIPKYIRFNHPHLNRILDALEDNPIFVQPNGKVQLPSILDTEILIGKGVYRMGIGGLHSSEKVQHVQADNQYILVDRDVRSYYPFIIINQELAPSHLGWAFLKVYKGIVFRRLAEKDKIDVIKKNIKALNQGTSDYAIVAAQMKAEMQVHFVNSESLKVTINGSFGKLGSPYSILFAPDLLIQTTLSGQLSLLLLILWIEDEDDMEVVSANTDGIVIRCHRDAVERMHDVVREWEAATKFETEEAEYSHLYSRDVNNYIAVKTDGTVKTKGAYAIAEPGKPPMLQKNPTNQICIEAVIEHITKGTSLTKTIRDCTDISKFLTVRTVNGGAVWDGDNRMLSEIQIDMEAYDDTKGKRRHRAKKPQIAVNIEHGEYLGKAIRWYYAKDLTSHIYYKKAKANGTHNRVPLSEGARPLMTLPDEFPDDIDVGWYVRECQEILMDIGFNDDLIGKVKRKARPVIEYNEDIDD